MRGRACSALAAAMGALALATPQALAAASPPALSARAATVVAPFTSERLYGLNADAQLPIASATKLMTALITLQHASMNAVFTYPGYALSSADSQIGLAAGEKMTVQDLFVAMLVPSADDAAYDLAYNIGHGSVGRFVAMMNAAARALGLTHTHYSTPIGLDTPGNYSSASDLVKLAGYLLDQYPLFAHVVAEPNAVLHSGSHVRAVVSRNDLLGRYPWIDGVKTGHTLAAGYVLVASARQHGLMLLSAVLGTPSQTARDGDTLALLNWAYSNYRLARLVRAGTVLARPRVPDQPSLRAVVVAGRTLARVVPTSSRTKIVVVLRHSLAGPLARGTPVGYAAVQVDGRPVGYVQLILGKRIPALSTLTQVVRFATRGSTLVLLAVLVCSLSVLVLRRRQQRRTQRTAA
jgi:D-alanyl-D-alanine carboxypeptidase (penicillin-binding protein 5/6)